MKWSLKDHLTSFGQIQSFVLLLSIQLIFPLLLVFRTFYLAFFCFIQILMLLLPSLEHLVFVLLLVALGIAARQ